jgi:DNA polymerase
MTSPSLPLLLERLNAHIGPCQDCVLHETRTHVVYGSGDGSSPLMVVGEAPGQDEDRSGIPFVGRSGRVLDKWILSLGQNREQVAVTNTVLCRPPKNRNPEAGESAACAPKLHARIALVRPKVLLAVGQPAAFALLPEAKAAKTPMRDLRQKMHTYRHPKEDFSVPLVVIYHPSYILRGNMKDEHLVLQDLELVRPFLG